MPSLQEILAKKKAAKLSTPEPRGIVSGTRAAIKTGGAPSEIVTPPASPVDVAISDVADFANEFNHDSQPESFGEDKVTDMRKALTFLANQIEHKEDVGQILKNLMMMMHATPELANIMEPKDIGLMVRGLQEGYGRVIIKKSERKAKSTKAQASLKEVEDLMAGMTITV